MNFETIEEVKLVPTCKLGFVPRQTFEAFTQGSEDALHSAKHGAESKIE